MSEWGGYHGAGIDGGPAKLDRVRRSLVDARIEANVKADAAGWHDDQARQAVDEWPWLLLRFAVTLAPQDARAVMSRAGAIDSLGRQGGACASTFFRRSSAEVCRAITAPDDPEREGILRRHILRIDHPRLRRAFQIAVSSEQTERPATSRHERSDLWAGLEAAKAEASVQTPAGARRSAPSA